MCSLTGLYCKACSKITLKTMFTSSILSKTKSAVLEYFTGTKLHCKEHEQQKMPKRFSFIAVLFHLHSWFFFSALKGQVGCKESHYLRMFPQYALKLRKMTSNLQYSLRTLNCGSLNVGRMHICGLLKFTLIVIFHLWHSCITNITSFITLH